MAMSISAAGVRAFDAHRAELRAAEVDRDRAHEDERRAEQRSQDAERRVERAERAVERRFDRYA